MPLSEDDRQFEWIRLRSHANALAASAAVGNLDQVSMFTKLVTDAADALRRDQAGKARTLADYVEAA